MPGPRPSRVESQGGTAARMTLLADDIDTAAAERLGRRARIAGVAKRFVGRAALLLLGFALAEAILRVALLAPPVRERLSATKPYFVADARLGVRGDPLLAGEHDARGFRNARPLAPGDVVAIGDSQTHGEFVARDDAWPQQLARASGLPVYQMAFGSYGPGQYDLLSEDVIEFGPRAIIVGLYFGNDFADAFRWVYHEGRSPALRSTSDAVLGELAAYRSLPPLNDDWRTTKDIYHGRSLATRRLAKGVLPHIKLFLLARRLASAVSLASNGTVREARWEDVLRIAAGADPDFLYPFEGARVRTVLTARARLAPQRMSDPRVREGVRIAIRAARRMQQRCSGEIPFGVLLIPTKELVFATALSASGARMPPPLRELLDTEGALRRDIQAELMQAGIVSIDPLPRLRQLVAEGRSPYRIDWNGHPNAIGHRALADAVAASGLLASAARERDSEAAARR